ncbi:MAG TPA: cation:proton antiporter, partial [Verrucomicrobiae bacterium]|nr:cation:proton antiporter [Verrucomicrobiae bacterium]
MKKSFFLYAFVLLVCGLGIFFSLERGQRLAPRPVSNPAVAAYNASGPVEIAGVNRGTPPGYSEKLQDPLGRLFLQLIVIVVSTRLAGMLFRKIGQPAVVGEMFAGVLLGPSLFGWLLPGGYQFIFPGASLATLKLLSQIGVCLFMFVVGMELDPGHLRTRARTALFVSHVSIVFPYFLGVALALVLYSTLSGPGAKFVPFALFIGISMSITAFPVLARILQERKLETTELGATAITCAAVGDVTAWILLAFVVAIARADGLLSVAWK